MGAPQRASAPPGAERRTNARYVVEGTHVSFRDPEDDDAVLKARVLDVSRDGVLVQVPRQHIDSWPALRTTITPLVLEFDEAHRLRCEAEVVWLGGQQTGGVRQYRSGLNFSQLTPEAEATLTAYLRSLRVEA